MIGILCAAALSASIQEAETLTLDLKSPGPAVSKSLFGIFFEEINNAGEGGLYAELLHNRALSPRGQTKLIGWNSTGADYSFVPSEKLNEAREGSISLKASGGKAVLINSGFWGIGVKKGQALSLRLWLKGRGKASSQITVGGVGATNTAEISLTSEWKEHKAVLTPTRQGKGQLEITLEKGGELILGYSSLMPVKTWKNRPNGLRPDLAERMLALKPGFMRFPGGCYVEGHNLGNRFEWRDTLKPIEQRKATPVTFWGYPSSNGLGYHEYLQMADDLNSDAMFVINCGMSHSEIKPMDKMGPYVQDALDAIEYAIGPTTSKMGAMRAARGRTKPFNLKYIEIGNENGYSWSFGGPAPYYERFALIHKAIKAKYPQILTISNVPTPVPADITTEHFYDTPSWFWRNRDRYDAYSRKGLPIYVGEYAVTRANGRGSLAGALGEAAYMTGMERNGDLVIMASYAPLFENVNNRQWNPNAINFDATRSFGAPSYWVQQVFASNRIDAAVKSSVTGLNSPPPPVQGGFGFRTWKTAADFKDVKVTIGGATVYEAAQPKLSDFEARRGRWIEGEGGVRQTTRDEDATLALKGVSAKATDDWSFEFSARATEGEEGFMAIFGYRGQEGTLQWNLGGWGNTIHAFQRDNDRRGRGVNGKIEHQVWHRVLLEKKGGVVSGTLNGKLVEALTEEGSPSLAASAGIDKARKELVIKIVNGLESPRTIKIKGLSASHMKSWKEILLTGPALSAENSFEKPENVAPKAGTRRGSDSISLAPRSLTVLRIPLASSDLKPSLDLFAEKKL